jgi:hypothetical protein
MENLPESRAMEHPFWCERDGCRERGWHVSRTLAARDGDREPVTVGLVQLTAPGAAPHLAVGPMLVSVRQAVVLRRFIGQLVEMAERSD